MTLQSAIAEIRKALEADRDCTDYYTGGMTLAEPALRILKALELAIEHTHGAIKANYWSMNKEYLAKESIDKFDQAIQRVLSE